MFLPPIVRLLFAPSNVSLISLAPTACLAGLLATPSMLIVMKNLILNTNKARLGLTFT